MDEIKLIVFTILLNVVIGIGLSVHSEPLANVASQIDIMQENLAIQDANARQLKSTDNWWTKAAGTFYSVVDAIISPFKSIAIFIGAFVGNFVAVPFGLITSGASSEIERAGGAFIGMILFFNNFILIKELYQLLINKKATQG